MFSGVGEARIRSSKILNPCPVRREARRSNSARLSRKNPLIGSLTRVPVTICASRMPASESRWREDEDNPALSPPSTCRLPIARSAPPATASSITGSRVSSCWRSPSITAT
jgi:hypothetical protein